MSEAGEIVRSGAVEKVVDLLHKLAGPATEQIGLMLGDKAWAYRAKNLIDVVKKTERKLQEAGLSANAVAPRLLLPIVESSSVEDDETLQEMWAGLLATASQEKYVVSPSFIETLKQLTPDEGRHLESIYADKRRSKWRFGPGLFPYAFTGESRAFRDSFERLGLIQRDYAVNTKASTSDDGSVEGVESEIAYAFHMTDWARRFMEACHGPQCKPPGS